MAITNSQTSVEFGNLIQSAIDKELKRGIEERFEVVKKDFLAKLDREKAEILAGVSLYLFKQVDFQTMNDRTIITLRTEEIKKPL